MELSLLVYEADGIALFRHIESGSGDQLKARRSVHEHRCSRSVTEQCIREDQAQVIAHLENRTADLNGHAHHHAAIRPEQGLRQLEIGDCPTAAAPHQVIDPGGAGQVQTLDEIGRDAGADVAGTGVHDKAGHVPGADSGLVQRLGSGLTGELDSVLREARNLLVGCFIHYLSRVVHGEMPFSDAGMGKGCPDQSQTPSIKPRGIVFLNQLRGKGLICAEGWHNTGE